VAPRVDNPDVEGTERRTRDNPRRTAPRSARTDEGQDRLLDVREAAMLLGLKPATLYQWAYKRRIPVVKLFGPRGALRFRLSDVDKLIQDSLRPAMSSCPATDRSSGPRG
jgi:excisionase family DNA binding protein